MLFSSMIKTLVPMKASWRLANRSPSRLGQMSVGEYSTGILRPEWIVTPDMLKLALPEYEKEILEDASVANDY